MASAEDAYQEEVLLALDHAEELVEQGQTDENIYDAVVDFCAGGMVNPNRDESFRLRLWARVAKARKEYT